MPTAPKCRSSACATWRRPPPAAATAPPPSPAPRCWPAASAFACLPQAGLAACIAGARQLRRVRRPLHPQPTPIGVVCAGVKSILDVGATLERLETLNVTVVGYRTTPLSRASTSRTAAARSIGRSTRREAAAVHSRSQLDRLGGGHRQPGGVEDQLDPELHRRVLDEALRAAATQQHPRQSDHTVSARLFPRTDGRRQRRGQPEAGARQRATRRTDRRRALSRESLLLSEKNSSNPRGVRQSPARNKSSNGTRLPAAQRALETAARRPQRRDTLPPWPRPCAGLLAKHRGAPLRQLLPPRVGARRPPAARQDAAHRRCRQRPVRRHGLHRPRLLSSTTTHSARHRPASGDRHSTSSSSAACSIASTSRSDSIATSS